MKNDITFTRSEVEKNLPEWAKVRDVVDGEAAVKGKGTTYLPQPNPTDESEQNRARYQQYLARASFLNATGRTMAGMIGIAFRRWPEVELPANLESLIENIDGTGVGLINQMQGCLENVLQVGGDGLLVDYPPTEGASSVADQREQGLQPTVTRYRAESIVNWRKDKRGRLTLVVLHETAEEPDEYSVSEVDQWRELYLDDAGRYAQRVWRKNDKDEAEVVEGYPVYPLDAGGQPWDEIPFVRVGAIDNAIEIDRAPLYDLAVLNLAHYRNSADYEESVYFVGQPTFVFAGLDDDWIASQWKDGAVYVGARGVIPLPVGGSADLLQASPNTLAGEALKKKEDQMIALGARLLAPGEAVKTAEQSRSETAAAHSVLSLACDNVSNAYTKVLQWAARFAGADEGSISVTIDTDFVGLMLDPNLVLAVVKSWQSGAIPKSDMFAAMRLLGLIDPAKTDEELNEEIDAEGGGLALEPMNPQAPPPNAPPAEPEA